jgi:anti-sigma factor RsiW
MTHEFTDAELEAYVDESLDPARAAEIERALKTDRALLRKLSWINGRRDAGVHSLGEIWRQAQIGVPSRDDVVRWVAGQLTADEADYLQFRVDTLKCRFTAALLADVRESAASPAMKEAESRQKKIFTSSEKLLKPRKRRS